MELPKKKIQKKKSVKRSLDFPAVVEEVKTVSEPPVSAMPPTIEGKTTELSTPLTSAGTVRLGLV